MTIRNRASPRTGAGPEKSTASNPSVTVATGSAGVAGTRCEGRRSPPGCSSRSRTRSRATAPSHAARLCGEARSDRSASRRAPRGHGDQRPTECPGAPRGAAPPPRSRTGTSSRQPSARSSRHALRAPPPPAPTTTRTAWEVTATAPPTPPSAAWRRHRRRNAMHRHASGNRSAQRFVRRPPPISHRRRPCEHRGHKTVAG